MEWIKKMGLKKALFTITFINTTLALLLSVLVIWGCVGLQARIAPNGVVIDPHSDPITMTPMPEPSEQALQIAEVISALQIILPIVIFALALFATASMFYRLKLKEPLGLLSDGANRIIGGDLDFTISARSEDELGRLCGAFETMRQSLLDNNRELWRQAEERKRLNAAFSHDLRNPITVLKGSAKMARQYALKVENRPAPLVEHLDRIESYTGRIERYVETMSNIQRLEEMQADKEQIDFHTLAEELKAAISFVVLDGGKGFSFSSKGSDSILRLDKAMLFQIAENLVSNALRFAEHTILVELLFSKDELTLSVLDDGCGFSNELLHNGVKPFQKGSEDNGHFGMGLFICDLLCKKHGGCLTFKNTKTGACVVATLKI